MKQCINCYMDIDDDWQDCNCFPNAPVTGEEDCESYEEMARHENRVIDQQEK